VGNKEGGGGGGEDREPGSSGQRNSGRGGKGREGGGGDGQGCRDKRRGGTSTQARREGHGRCGVSCHSIGLRLSHVVKGRGENVTVEYHSPL